MTHACTCAHCDRARRDLAELDARIDVAVAIFKEGRSPRHFEVRDELLSLREGRGQLLDRLADHERAAARRRVPRDCGNADCTACRLERDELVRRDADYDEAQRRNEA